jgi:hypothetical protein
VARAATAVSIDVQGLDETLAAIQTLERDFARPAANRQLRDGAGTCAGRLGDELRHSAASSGVPVAPRVASSIRVKRDRIPAVEIGGGQAVGRTGGLASDLVWGSEQGPKGEVNHFGVPPSSGYWIAPAVERFGSSGAVDVYRRACADVIKAAGL